MSSLLALIPQPLLPRGEGEQDFQVPLPVGERFRVRAVRSLAKVTYSRSHLDSESVVLKSFDGFFAQMRSRLSLLIEEFSDRSHDSAKIGRSLVDNVMLVSETLLC